MYFHFNKLGQMRATDNKLNPDSHSELKGFNYPNINVANQAWQQWAMDYCEHCFTLNAPPNSCQNYTLDYDA